MSSATFTRLGVNVKVGWVPTGHGASRCYSIAIGVFFADKCRLPKKNIAGDMNEHKEFDASYFAKTILKLVGRPNAK